MFQNTLKNNELSAHNMQYVKYISVYLKIYKKRLRLKDSWTNVIIDCEYVIFYNRIRFLKVNVRKIWVYCNMSS